MSPRGYYFTYFNIGHHDLSILLSLQYCCHLTDLLIIFWHFDNFMMAFFELPADKNVLIFQNGRHSGLMVSALDSGLSSPGLSPGQGYCIVFLGKTLHSYSASFHPGV